MDVRLVQAQRRKEGACILACDAHASPVVTRRYYDHFVRKSFSPEIRRGLGIKAPKKKQGEVVPMRKAKEGKEGRAARQEKNGKTRRRKGKKPA